MKTELFNLVECVEHLPVLPATTVRLIQLLGDNTGNIDEIIEVIQYDQSLTLQVLKLCNSAYFGLVRKITSLKDAVVYMGSRHIMQIVLGLHCNSILQKPQKGYGLEAGMLWKHSTAVALATERIGRLRKDNVLSSGILFTSGLLHDVGKVILDQVLTDSYAEVTKLVDSKSITFHQAEHEILGYSHTEVGELIMLHWKLPLSTGGVCRHNHEPHNYDGSDAITRQLIEIVHLGDSLVLTLGIGVGNDGLLYTIDNQLAEKYGLKVEDVEKISSEVLYELQQLEKLYQEK
jgi:HD-like signal output (HDOD) protein